MLGYIISYIILGLLLLGYIPAMIAASKNHSFYRWYAFGVVLFPIALAGALRLRKPVRIVNIIKFSDANSRKKKGFRYIPKKDNNRGFSFRYLLAVLLTKFIFSAFLGLMAFAIIRTYSYNADHLMLVCIGFSVINTFMLAAVEIFRLSRLPIIADEVTKRALQILVISAVASLPMFFAKNIITDNIAVHRQFTRFLCTLVSFVVFLVLLFRLQTRYYGRFSRFFDYCGLSICAYAVYSSITLVLLSLSKVLSISIYPVAMQIQMFNFTYFSTVREIVNISSIYLGAVVHLIVAVLLLFSGMRCRAYKKKELEFRVEYRAKAFRTSHKRALYRHIPKVNALVKTSK